MAELTLLAVHQGGGVGGAPVSLLKLLAALSREPFAPRVVFTEPGPLLDYAGFVGVPATVVPTGGAFYYSAHARLGARMLARFVSSYPAAVRRAQCALAQARPDLLHLNTSVLLAWAAAARRQRIPVVWVVREVLGPNSVARRWHARYILRHATRVVAVSGAVRACFPPNSRVSVVYNAVDPREFPAIEPGSGDWLAARRALRLDPADAVIMMLGSVQRAKGHWLLLDALEALLVQHGGGAPTVVRAEPARRESVEERPMDLHRRGRAGAKVGGREVGDDAPAQRKLPDLARTRLALVAGGVGPGYAKSVRGRLKRALGRPLDNLDALLRDAAGRGLRERVVATGFRQDVARAVAAADVVAFPSLAPEGFGRPIIEAMAAGRPVVATNVGPSAELLGPDAGLLVPPDAHALADGLARLLGSAELRRQMGSAGRARVAQHFTLDRQVAAMAQVYREAASGA